MTKTAVIYRVEWLSERLKQVYATFFPEQNEANSRGKLEWRFERNPAGAGRIVVAEANGEIVGLSSYVPAVIQAGDETATGYQAIDSFVHPSMRGRGLFSELARTFVQRAEDPIEVVYGIPNDQAAPAWFGKLGWTRHGTMPFLFKPLSSSYFLRRMGLAGGFSLSVARDQNAQLLHRFGPGVDELWREFSKGVTNAVRRDSAYLNWRIIDCPSAGYRTVASSDSSFVTTYAAAKHGGKIGYVMEAMGADASDLLMSELGRMRSHDVEVALAWCSPESPNIQLYRRAGFIPLPERLRPVVMYFGATANSERVDIVTKRPWHVSYLDSDTV